MKRPKIAVMGAGNWGRNHVRTLATLADAELAAVCDMDAGRREEVQRGFPYVMVTEDAEAAMNAADGVVVATPAGTHAELALAAIELGLPVLIEKPMAMSVEDSLRIVEAGDANDVPVLVGHLLLFHPAVRRLESMMRGGELGSVYYLYGRRVNLGQVRPDENALWSFGPHDVSVTVALLGELPTRVAAFGRSFLQPGVEDVVFFTMEFASGVMVQVQMSWLDPHKERRLTIVGSEKMVVFDDMQAREKLKVFDRGIDRPPDYGSFGESLSVREGDIWIPRISNVEPLRAELEHFVSVVRGEESPRVTARDGLDVVRILCAASESLTEGGRTVDLKPAGALKT